MILINEKLKLDIEKDPQLISKVSFYSQESLKQIIEKANKLKISKIYHKTDKVEELLVKVKNRWVVIDHFKINLTYIKRNSFYLKSDIIFDNGVKTDSVNYDVKYIFEKNTFCYNNDQDLQKIKFLVTEDAYNELKSNFDEAINFSKTKISKDNFDKFNNDLLDPKIKQPGIPKSKSQKINENFVKFWTKNSESFIEFKDNSISILTINSKENFAKNNHYNNAINNNIINNAKQVVNNPQKISKSNIIKGIIGLIVVIFLSWFTFGHIFGTENLNLAFIILGDKTTWIHPWVYILIANFIVTFFYTFFMMFVLAMFTGAKVNMKQRWNLFLSMQIRQIALFVTGNFIIATTIWAIYMNYKSGVRTSSLIGTMSMMGIIRSIFQLIMALVFLVPGTFYLANMFADPLMAIPVFILGWGGLFWSSMHNVITSSVVFVPAIQNVYVKAKTNILLRKNDSSSQLTKVNSEMFFLSQGFNGVFKNKQRIYSMLLMTVGMTLFEAIETVMIFQVVDDYYVESLQTPLLGVPGHYWNIFGIAGVRLMSSYVHMFPLLNIVPGQGTGITDLFMSNVNIMVAAKQHGLDGVGISSLSDTDYLALSQFSNCATIITRFLNFYLRKMISLFITIWIVFKITYKTITKKHHKTHRL